MWLDKYLLKQAFKEQMLTKHWLKMQKPSMGRVVLVKLSSKSPVKDIQCDFNANWIILLFIIPYLFNLPPPFFFPWLLCFFLSPAPSASFVMFLFCLSWSVSIFSLLSVILRPCFLLLSPHLSFCNILCLPQLSSLPLGLVVCSWDKNIIHGVSLINYFKCACVCVCVLCWHENLSPRVTISKRLVLFVVFVLGSLINKWE